MAYTIDRPSRTYKTWIGDFTLTQEIKQNGNRIKTNFEIVSSEHSIEVSTDWVDYPPTNMMEIIEKAAPMISNYLPLIETTDVSRQRNWLCSTYLLSNDKKIKMYMPKAYSINLLKGARERKDRLYLTDGEHVLNPKYNEIKAILIE